MSDNQEQQDHDETPEVQEETERRHTIASQTLSVMMEGELLKQGGFMKSWKTRWFELLPDSIAYFDVKGGKIKGGILLETIQLVRPASEQECKKPHCFAVATSVGRTYLFVAANDGEMKKWMGSIMDCKAKLDSEATETPVAKVSGSIGTLYCNPSSSNGCGIWALVTSAGLSIDIEPVDLTKSEQLTPEFLAINPLHQIPAFKGSDGVCIFENNAILRYLCYKYPTQVGKFYPEPAAVRARVDMALDFRNTTLYGAISKVVYPYFGFGAVGEEQQAAFDVLIEKKEGLNDGALGVLEKFFLHNKKFIAGEELSIADFAVRNVLTMVEGTKDKPLEIKLSERLTQYLADVDANSTYCDTTKKFTNMLRVSRGEPPIEEDKAPAPVESGVDDDLAKIAAIKESNPGNLGIKHFDMDYYNTLSDDEKADLLKCASSGIHNPDSQTGCYAMQPSDYDRFKPYFGKVLAAYHKVEEGTKHVNDWSLDGVEGLPEGGKLDLSALGLPALSMRVRVGRNLKEFPLPGAMSQDQRVALEAKMCTAFDKLKAMPEYGGGYNSLTPGHPDFIDEAAYNTLVADHIMFKDMAADSYLSTAGIASHWPFGRGCYVSEDRSFVIWVGEEDHLRIMCMQKGVMLNDVFDRLKAALDVVNSIEGLEFAMSEDNGVVTSCPTNLGTGMRASVHIPIPNLTSDGTDAKAKAICKPLGLSVRGTGGEHTPIGADGTCDISPSARFCITEAQIITALYNGLKLLKEEEAKAGDE